MTIHCIACGVFQPALSLLELGHRHPTVRITYLPAHLHLRPERLRDALREAIGATEPGTRCVTLLGECFTGVDDFCQSHDTKRLACRNCYELLLGPTRYDALLEEQAGTFFLERELILGFDECCRAPLELDDADLRSDYFRHYRRAVYIRQPGDPDLLDRAQRVASFLDLRLQIEESDYTEFRRRLKSLVGEP